MDGEPQLAISFQLSANSKQWPMNSGQRTVNGSRHQLSAISKLRTVTSKRQNDEQRAVTQLSAGNFVTARRSASFAPGGELMRPDSAGSASMFSIVRRREELIGKLAQGIFPLFSTACSIFSG
ncbi:MAG TPA: hypothetical protein VGR47_14740 [Terracidiphilus sp.]|nr:hypothetical protein [Terracidiphilus sp.]